MQFRGLILGLFGFWTSGAVIADKVEISGFGTVSAVVSNSDIYGFRQDVSYGKGVYRGDIDLLSTSLVGLQADVPVSERLSITGQAIVRDRSKNTIDDAISQLFFKYSFNPGLNARIGRLPLDLFALTEFRDIGYAYPWSVAPMEVYGLVPNRSLDGIDVSYTSRFSSSTLTTNVYGGRSSTFAFTQGNQADIELQNIVGLSLDLSTLDWYVKLRHTQGTFGDNPENTKGFLYQIDQIPTLLWPGVKDFIENFSFKGKVIEYSSASAQYNLGRWSLGGEYSWIRSDVAAVERVEGGYVSLSYRLEDLSFYSVFGFADSNSYEFDEVITVPPAQFPGYAEFTYGINAAMNSFSSNQESFSIGLRYELYDNAALKLQWTQTNIDEWGGALWHSSHVERRPDEFRTLFFGLSFIF